MDRNSEKTMTRAKFSLGVIAAACGLMTAALVGARAANVVDEWSSVKMPPAPQLKKVTVEPKTTALLLLDFQNPICTSRPRCIATMPAMKKLLTEARAKGVMVVYSLAGKATTADILPDVAPIAGEPSVRSSVDKFAGTDLEKILVDRGIRSVIVTGVAAHGAVLYTGTAAALRGMNVIVPVDGMASEDPFYELATAWLLANGVGGIGQRVSLTKTDMIAY
jgi:nicotinamidase-related amidase